MNTRAMVLGTAVDAAARMVLPTLAARARRLGTTGLVSTGIGSDATLVADAAATAFDDPAVPSSALFLFFLTYVAYAALYLARKPVSVVKTTLMSELGLSITSLGHIDSALLLAYTLGQLLLGRFALHEAQLAAPLTRKSALALAVARCLAL